MVRRKNAFKPQFPYWSLEVGPGIHMSHQVLLVEHQPVIQLGLSQILSGTEFEIFGVAASVTSAIEEIRTSQVDLVLCDFGLPDGDAVQVFSAANEANCPALVFSGYDNPMYISRAIDAGAKGLVSRSAPPADLIDAMRQVVEGHTTWKRSEMRRVTGALATNRLDSDIDLPLTQREYQILSGVARGLTNKLIADELTISYETVKEHVQHILRKLGVADRTQAAVWAVRKGVM